MVEPSIPEYWRGINVRFRLEGNECGECGRQLFPPRSICPRCKSIKTIPKIFSGKGKLRSYTIVSEAPKGMELYVPYIMGLVQLDEGPTVTAQIVDVDPEKLEIGLDLEVVFRKLSAGGRRGIVRYGFKFRPLQYSLKTT